MRETGSREYTEQAGGLMSPKLTASAIIEGLMKGKQDGKM
jgi:hypothetical protein